MRVVGINEGWDTWIMDWAYGIKVALKLGLRLNLWASQQLRPIQYIVGVFSIFTRINNF